MRTEEEVLQDFEKLGYKVEQNSSAVCLLTMNDFHIDISKSGKNYSFSAWSYLTMQEHKLLTELFQIWNWL